MKTQKVILSTKERRLTASILKRTENEKGKTEVEIMSFDFLFTLLNKDEKKLVKKLRDINPLAYGFKGRYLGIQKVPNNLVSMHNQKYTSGGKTKKIGTQYLPRPVFVAYKKLNAALYKNTKKKLLVGSGYRSPAYQSMVFLWYLSHHKFNFSKTIKRVAIPGYSEHGFAKGQAVDFITMDGFPNDDKPSDFSKTIEYAWLLENAGTFHFYESYPRNNKSGIIFEPWHWHYRK